MAEESKKSKKPKESTKKKEETPAQEEVEKKILAAYDQKIKDLRELELGKADIWKLVLSIISDPPYKTEREEVKLKYVVLFNDYLKKIPNEKFETELLEKLTKDDLVKLYDYLNKTFEFLSDVKDVKDGENIFKVNSTTLLKLHQKIMEKYGNSILFYFMSNKKCLSAKVKYSTKTK